LTNICRTTFILWATQVTLRQRTWRLRAFWIFNKRWGGVKRG